jgi:signal transduction histidine kinase
VVAGAAAAITAGAVAEGRLWAHHPLLTVVNLLGTVAFTVTGVLLSEDRAQRGTAWALILAGITLPLGWLDQWGAGPMPLYSVVFGYLSDIFGAWALLRYPEPRLSPGHRRFCTVLAGWLVLGPLFLACISRPAWWGLPFHASAWWPTLWPARAVFHSAQYVFDVGTVVLAGTFLALLAGRLRSASRRDRVILLPVITAAMLAAVAAGAVMTIAAVSRPSDELWAIEGVAQLTVPVGFLVSITQQRLVRMAHLVAHFDGAAPTAELLRQVLRVNLRDADLDLLIWSPADKTYRTVQGRVADSDALAAGRTEVEVTGREGRRLALLMVGLSSARDHSLLTTAAVMSRLTLENALLSRRLLAADYDARQQLASDLHDGVQNKLCGALLALSSATHSADDATHASLDRVSLRISEALSELRDLARDVYPQALARLGLRAAVEDAAGHLDLPADISTPGEDLPAGTEKTLYFMICEALTNIYRHAHASTVNVTVTRTGDMAEAIIADDGVGGADPNGSGLARMRDRAEADGGVLDIDSPHGKGTTLTMTVPCA